MYEKKKKHQHISTFSLFYSFTRGRAISISPSDFETNPLPISYRYIEPVKHIPMQTT